jgi:hypothetical protein
LDWGTVQERQKGVVEDATNTREWKQARVASSTKKNAGGQGRSWVGRETNQDDDDNKRRELEKRWRSVKRVKYDLWALEPSGQWLKGGQAEGRKRRLKRSSLGPR